MPSPVLTSFRLRGGEHQFGYAYHQRARFADDRAVMQTMENPAPDIYACNEAFSGDQGWVNDPIRSADLVLGP